MQQRAEPPASVGLWSQLKGFDRLFWIANWMEMLERLAYYGLRTVVPIYMVLAYESGGPQFSHVQKGTIFAWWAMIQSFVPMLSGGYADRYGFKKTIAVSVALKMAGYLVMAYAIDLAALFVGGDVAVQRGAAGGALTYPIFFAGAMLLAGGTAVFKPGLQGLLAAIIPKSSASLGWAIFYQLVNIGGFIGPMLAGYLRILEWRYVFIACAIIVALNYPMLLTFKEPPRAGEGFGRAGPVKVLVDSVRGLFEPRLLGFTLIFAGFWLMFYQLFDILPNFIQDWVDSSMVLNFLEPARGLFGFASGWPAEWGGHLPQEYLINLNAGLISVFAFLVGHVTGNLPVLRTIVVGIGVAALGIVLLSVSPLGTGILLAIAVFSLGEMIASPKKMEYLASIAPPGKEGLYMGYVNVTVGIGWSLGSKIAGHLYESGGDKVNLAKRHLLSLGLSPESVEALPKTEVLGTLATKMGVGVAEAQRFLWDTYQPYSMWYVFAAFGAFSMFGMVVYDRLVRRADAKRLEAQP